MKKAIVLKRICTLFLAFAIALTFNFSVFANVTVGMTDSSSDIKIMQTDLIFDDATMKKASGLIRHFFAEQPAEYDIGNAFVVYNADEDYIIYNIPVFSGVKCVAVIQMNEQGGMSITDNTQIYTNATALPANEYILYVTGGVIYAESADEIIVLEETGILASLNESYVSETFSDKKNIISEKAGDLCEMNLLVLPNNDLVNSQAAAYSVASPNVIVPMLGGKTCDIKDFVLQGPYGICWAATVATIVNYKKRLSLSAIDVALQMGHTDYYDIENYAGGDAFTIIAALDYYGLTYTLYGEKISWNSVKSEINADRPFIICLLSTKGNHTVTAYGYTCHYNDTLDYLEERYIEIWESNGRELSFYYYDTYYPIGGYNFTWEETIR